MILLAVDPSLRSTGVALFREGTLIAVGRIRPPAGPQLPADIAYRCRVIAESIEAWVERCLSMAHPAEVVLEWPQVYRGPKAKGDPNDLLGLAGVCAAVATIYREAGVTCYRPDQWEPAPKVSPERKRRGLGPIDSEAFTSPRGIRIMGRLSAAERTLVPQSHDAVDSVGIGLFHLGRLAPRRVFHGAIP